MKKEEAIKILREVHDDSLFSVRNALETLIPELKESEDERIRKEIIDFIQWAEDMDMTRHDYHQAKRSAVWISYLEKQKEQKEEVASAIYDTEKQEIIGYQTKNGLFIPKGEPAEWKPLEESMEALLLAIEGKWDAIKPTGYMSRRLEDLYDGLVNTFNIEEAYLPKTNYTEKDIEELKTLKSKIDASIEQKSNIEICPHSIKSKSYSEQKPAEWSYEDESNLQSCIAKIEIDMQHWCNHGKTMVDGDRRLIGWLKSLPERFGIQPKQEWSEEDRKMLNTIISDGSRGVEFDAKQVNWLKSLCPQYRWKPSEEQMDALEYFVQKHKAEANVATGIWIDYENLVSLRNDLRKL